MNLHRINFSIPICALIITGCVSVRLEDQKIERSHEVQFVNPKPPFLKQESKSVDQLWQNAKNGNTISFLTDCNNESDPSLENIQKGIVSEIDYLETLQSSPVEYNEREALHSIADGKVDGVPSRLELVIFKKHSCIYIITYAAVTKSYGYNQRDFQQFLKEFVVP